jgi:protein TonB
MHHHSKFGYVLLLGLSATVLLDGCSSGAPYPGDQYAGMPAANVTASRFDHADTTADGTSTARTVDAYKRDLALRITEVNSTKIYPGQPQALLRAVIVVRFTVDGGGKLIRSNIVRSNHDSAAEATAVASLRNAAPFPKPPSILLQNGRLELTETWLFNKDGRFQIRSVAQAQMAE